jgi:hypothetical protein
LQVTRNGPVEAFLVVDLRASQLAPDTTELFVSITTDTGAMYLASVNVPAEFQ